jgi:hypothetical protein
MKNIIAIAILTAISNPLWAGSASLKPLELNSVTPQAITAVALPQAAILPVPADNFTRLEKYQLLKKVVAQTCTDEIGGNKVLRWLREDGFKDAQAYTVDESFAISDGALQFNRRCVQGAINTHGSVFSTALSNAGLRAPGRDFVSNSDARDWLEETTRLDPKSPGYPGLFQNYSLNRFIKLLREKLDFSNANRDILKMEWKNGELVMPK